MAALGTQKSLSGDSLIERLPHELLEEILRYASLPRMPEGRRSLSERHPGKSSNLRNFEDLSY